MDGTQKIRTAGLFLVLARPLCGITFGEGPDQGKDSENAAKQWLCDQRPIVWVSIHLKSK